MPLETLPDRFNDTTHDELDEAVDGAIEEDITDENLSARDMAQLLGAIIEHCDDLGRKYVSMAKAKKMIQTHGELRAMLTSAWRHKSYREIRNLGVWLQSILNI